MPNRYEREIEEILRNLEQTGPRPGLGRKLSGRIRRKSDYSAHTRGRGLPLLNLSASVWFLAIAVAAALFAGGFAYAQGEANPVTGIVAVVGALCLLLVVLSPFFSASHHTQATGYSNMTPLRTNPLQGLVARWNLLLLRLRYRRRPK
jgi:hypothetical protein